MMANPEKNPDASIAVEYAEDLWEALVKADYISAKKAEKTKGG